MKVKVAKWGNSLAVRLPKQFVDALGLKTGSSVDLDRDGSRLTMETAPERRKIPVYRLEDLLAQIKPGTKPPPFEDWGILPSEWPQDDWSDIAPTDEEWEAAKREAKERRSEKGPARRPEPSESPKERRGAARRRRRV
jgi:antitoxin MazE